ncbi:RagB/SusD family nutrient uptake outer membrane protein [Chitinophaga sp. NPDC101104]|uniref:RagB/SusD family nutrient uptake outer membrane protein n=1 Tax=Chitinophaga sp. NPDC101104 TaxID=3390561 RepID=UPI003CFBCAF2
MQFKYIFLTLAAAALSVTGCNKFLDVKPKGIVIPDKVNDFQLMLNSRNMNFSYPTVLLEISDDYYEEFDDLSTAPSANAYFWREGLDQNEQSDPIAWGPLYNTIYHANVIINNVLKVSDGTEAQRKSVEAEALVIRSDCYFTLLTIFAKAYNPATAAKDPGLPLVTSTDVTDKTPQRASVQVTLDSMLNALHRAIPSLPLTNLNKHRPTKYAAYGLLARIYLYMRNFPEAGKYADLALSMQHTLIDYNDYVDVWDFPSMDSNPEVLWQRGSLDYMLPAGGRLQKSLADLYPDSDRRKTLLTYEWPAGSGFYTYNAEPGWFNFGSTFPEMYLTKAEALARMDQPAAAMDVINQLRRYRIDTDAYAPLTAANKTDALQKVLLERRKELAFRGQRWMDMKRLDQEGLMPKVDRVLRSTGAVQATLAPGDKKYVFQIPARVQQFNPDIILNDR